jgi:uncharacterized protein YbjT (DUF2867 family)
MSRILVTGASGDIGRETVMHLLKKRPASDLAGLVRDPAKAEPMSPAEYLRSVAEAAPAQASAS